jgi:hypothetical protein
MKTAIHPLRIVVKALCLFVAINIIYALVDPPLSRISAYNTVFPGRVRMPFGDIADPYVVMIDDVDAMLASHEIAKNRIDQEYRVVLIGDSSIWGENLSAQESLSEQWNAMKIQCRDRAMKVYNLGYPHPSVIKDLIIMDKAIEYKPDMIIWFVTLNTLIPRRLSPFLMANRERAVHLLNEHNLPFEQQEALTEKEPTFYQKTLIGQRSHLARWVKLQLLGIVWAATEADINVSAQSKTDNGPSPNVENDLRYRGMEPTPDLKKLILFDALKAGHDIAGSIPILIVNEPMVIASGENKQVRYNEGYPRWAYDQYREALAAESKSAGWKYLDIWDAIPPQYFADSTLHLSAKGERVLIEQINPTLQSIACQN